MTTTARIMLSRNQGEFRHDGQIFHITNPGLALGHGLYPMTLDTTLGAAAVAWDLHDCKAEDADKFLEWLNKRGGVCVWQSLDLHTPGKTWSAPFRDPDMQINPKPHWSCDVQPVRLISRPEEVEVSVDVEVERFRVAVRTRGLHSMLGSFPMALECTTSSSNKINKAVARHGKGASYHFDYAAQEAVITAAALQVPLLKWLQVRLAPLWLQFKLGKGSGGRAGPYIGFMEARQKALESLEQQPDISRIFIVTKLAAHAEPGEWLQIVDRRSLPRKKKAS